MTFVEQKLPVKIVKVTVCHKGTHLKYLYRSMFGSKQILTVASLPMLLRNFRYILTLIMVFISTRNALLCLT